MSITPRTLSYKRPQKVGYRKTDIKVQSRRTPAQMPEMRMELSLPTNLVFGMPPGPVKGAEQVRMVDGNRAEIKGKDRNYLCEQAAKFIRLIAKKHQADRIQASIWRGDEQLKGHITFVTGSPGVIVDGLAMRPMYFEN